MASKKKVPSQTTKKTAAVQVSKEHKAKKSNHKFIFGAIAVIILLSGLQMILLHTVTTTSLKPLDPKVEIKLQVVRVLDLDFPFLRDAEFASCLTLVAKTIKEKTGFSVVFEQNEKIINDESSTAQDIFTDSKAAETWFSSQLAVSKGWQTNFAWLTAIMQNPASRRILEAHYGTNDLVKKITRDFSKKITSLIAIKGVRGKRIFEDPRRQALSSSAWWHYLLGKQADGDLVVANYPIFYPSALTPVDAITRGGLVTSMLAPSSRPLGMAVAISTWPVYGREEYSKETAQKILSELTTQALARVVLRRGFDLGKPRSLLYPALGENLYSWYNNGTREPASPAPAPVQEL